MTSAIGFGDAFRRENVHNAGIQHQARPLTILDVGCGTGKLTIATALESKPGSKIYGIDPEPSMLEIAHANAIKANITTSSETQLKFLLGKIEILPFETNQFDLVLATMMTHHLDRRLKFLGFREIFRVLKPGGTFLNVDFGIFDTKDNYSLKSTVKLGVFLYFNIFETIHRNFLLLVKDHFTGVLPPLLRRAGFIHVRALHSNHKWVVSLKAQKPRIKWNRD